MTRLTPLIFAASLLAACVGTRSLDKEGSGGSGGGSAGSAGAAGVGPTSYTAEQVQAALDSCDLPHGPAVTINNSNDVKARVVGAWLVCPASTASQPDTMFTTGIQFEPNGLFETLKPTGDGGLQTDQGVLSQGQWSTFCEVSSTVTGTDPCPGIGYYGPLVRIQVVAGDESPTGCFVGPFSFETSPSRAYVVDWPQLYCSASYTGDQFSFWLVPLR